MNELVDRWQARGRFVEHGGLRLFRVVEGQGPDLVCFHGFPSNSFDWHRLMPLLTARHRVCLFDFPGSGLSEKPTNYSYSLIDQFTLAEQLLVAEGFEAFDLVCHNMGDTIGCELFYRLQHHQTSLQVRRAVFLNGSVYMDLHHPLPTQRLLRVRLIGPLLARLSTKPLFKRQFGSLFARRDTLSEEEFDAYWTLLRANGGRRTLAKVAQYMNERLKREERWVEPLKHLEFPLLLLWGENDPVSLPAIAERLNADVPTSQLTWLSGVGHYPQLEAPEQVAAAIEAFL